MKRSPVFPEAVLMWNMGTRERTGLDCWNTKEAKVAKMTGGPIFVCLAFLVFITGRLTA